MVQILEWPYTGTILYLLLLSIIAGLGFKSLLLGLHQWREQRIGWYCQPMIIAGIAILLMSVGQIPNVLIPIYVLHLNLSSSIEALFNIIANASVLLFLALIC